MCSGGNDRRREAERDAERRQQEANEQAARRQRELDEQAAARQAELDALAAQRADTARQQQDRRNQLEVQAQRQIAAQTARGVELSRQQDLKIQGMRQASEARNAAVRAEGERKSRVIKTVGGAVSSSLRAMAVKQPMAPSAGQTSQKDRKKGAANKQAELRRGSTVTRGPNLSI